MVRTVYGRAMVTMLRRLFWLGLLGGGGYAGWMFWQQREGDDSDAAPEWPPLDPPSTPTIAASIPTADPTPPLEPPVNGFASLPIEETPDSTQTAPLSEVPTRQESNPEAADPVASDDDRTPAEAIATPNGSTPPHWADPVGDGCPDDYPIKVNDNSGIYHVPGGRFYDRTVPQRCYAQAVDAEADGYRAAKS